MRPWLTILSLTVVALGAVSAIEAQPIDGAIPLKRMVTRLEDKPQSLTKNQVKEFEDAIKPYIEKAKASLADAKKRYLQGLPNGEMFFVTTRLKDPSGRLEQVFVHVNNWTDDTAYGTIASELMTVTSYSKNQQIKVPEKEIIDWTIAKNDGSEEGNFVGKFLDNYTPEPAK